MLKSVTSSQIFSLFNLYIFTTLIAFLAGALISGSNYSTPVATLIGSILALLMMYPSYRVGMSRPDQFLSDYGREIVGSTLHTIFIILIVIANFALAAVNLRNLSDFLLMEYLVGTPSWSVILLFCICVAYAVRSGLPTIFRVAQGIFIITAIVFFVIPFLSAAEIEQDMLIALITHLNFKHLGVGTYITTTVFGELAFIYLVFPYLHAPGKLYKTFFTTTISSLFLIFTHLIPILLAFGPDLAANLTYPDMELIRFIRNGSFFETLDPILIILWLTSLFVKIAFTIFIIVSCLSQLTKTKDHKPFTLSVTAFAAVLSLTIARSQPELNEYILVGGLPILLITEFIIPWIYWIVGAFRSPRRANNNQPNKT
ncbi:Spore germination protein YndE [compost metagenome]